MHPRLFENALLQETEHRALTTPYAVAERVHLQTLARQQNGVETMSDRTPRPASS
jgi:hypothetical protein